MKEIIQTYFKDNYQGFYRKYLEDIKKIGGNEFKGLCPFHDEMEPSFNFSNETGQYFCHGCNKKGDIFHFYGKKHSLHTKRDFGKILKGIANDFGIQWEEQKKRLVKTYDYNDADGNLLFQVCRMDPKDFRQRRPDGHGGWVWNLKGIEPVPYRLQEMLEAPEVIIGEGEKDVDNLMELGFAATTCPMGAGKWKDNYNEFLKGKDIVLIPDNDLQGREHMAMIGASLNGIAKSIKWLELPNLPSKGDVSDWISKHDNKAKTKDLLNGMIKIIGPYKPPKKMSLEDVIMDEQDFIKLELPPKRKILNPWVEEQSIILMYSWRGVGKTWTALSILDAVTKGESFGPWETITPVKCLFLDAEMVGQDTQKRLNPGNRKQPLLIYSDYYANINGIPRAHLANESWRTKIKSILTTKKVKLWVIDNLSSIATGMDMNTDKDWGPVNAWLLELRFAGITTIMLHHEGKGGSQRGTSSREDNIDVSARLKRPHSYTAEEGCRFIIHFEKQRLPLEDLPLITDTELQLIQDEKGRYVWTFGSVKKETRKAIIELFDDGLNGTEIAKTLGIDKGYVSRTRKQAVKDGYLTEKGSVTSSGYLMINE